MNYLLVDQVSCIYIISWITLSKLKMCTLCGLDTVYCGKYALLDHCVVDKIIEVFP